MVGSVPGRAGGSPGALASTLEPGRGGLAVSAAAVWAFLAPVMMGANSAAFVGWTAVVLSLVVAFDLPRESGATGGPGGLRRGVLRVWVAFLAYLAITLFWTPSPRQSMLFFFRWQSLILLGFTLAVSRGPGRQTLALVSWMGFVAALVGAAAVVEYVTWEGAAPGGWIDSAHHSQLRARAATVFLNPNLLAVFLALHLPVALSMLMDAVEGTSTALWGAATFLQGTALLLTFSRGGWLGVGGGLLLWALFAWKREVPRKRLVVLGMAFAVVLVAVGGEVAERAATVSKTQELGVSERLSLYRAQLHYLRDHWLGGSGLFTFESLFPRYREHGGFYYLEAHNNVMQLALETGVLGAFLYMALLVMAVAWVWREDRGRWPRSEAGGEVSLEAANRRREWPVQWLDVGLVSGLVAFLGATMFAGSFRYLAVEMPFWVYLGLLLRRRWEEESDRETRRPGSPDGAGAGQAENGHFWAAGGLAVVLRGAACAGALFWACYLATDPSVGWIGAERSARWLPFRDDVHLELARIREREGDWKGAEEALARAGSLNPIEAEYPFRRARLLMKAGRLDEAQEYLTKCLEMDPHSEVYLFERSRLWRKQGRLEESLEALRRAWGTNPRYRRINPVFLKIGWSLARDLAERGRGAEVNELLSELKDMEAEFEARGMAESRIRPISK